VLVAKKISAKKEKVLPTDISSLLIAKKYMEIKNDVLIACQQCELYAKVTSEELIKMIFLVLMQKSFIKAKVQLKLSTVKML
jgi:hypothetical protein